MTPDNPKCGDELDPRPATLSFSDGTAVGLGDPA